MQTRFAVMHDDACKGSWRPVAGKWSQECSNKGRREGLLSRQNVALIGHISFKSFGSNGSPSHCRRAAPESCGICFHLCMPPGTSNLLNHSSALQACAAFLQGASFNVSAIMNYVQQVRSCLAAKAHLASDQETAIRKGHKFNMTLH